MLTIAMALHSNSECYAAMASLDDVLVSHILEWIYCEGFDKIRPEKVTEAILNSVRKCKRKWQHVQKDHYVISRQSYTFFMQLGNNCTQMCVITYTNRSPTSAVQGKTGFEAYTKIPNAGHLKAFGYAHVEKYERQKFDAKGKEM